VREVIIDEYIFLCSVVSVVLFIVVPLSTDNSVTLCTKSVFALVLTGHVNLRGWHKEGYALKVLIKFFQWNATSFRHKRLEGFGRKLESREARMAEQRTQKKRALEKPQIANTR
jgi:hypothetical protein